MKDLMSAELQALTGNYTPVYENRLKVYNGPFKVIEFIFGLRLK